MQPKFKHDCENCIFVGHFENHDVYVCSQSSSGGSIIARYGNDGPDYASSPFNCLNSILANPEITEIDYVKAWKQALDKLAPLAKILPLADTLQQLADEPNSKLMA